MGAEFVWRMEEVLDLYAEPEDPLRPRVCFDEMPYQLIAETQAPLPMQAGQAERYDYEYRRMGTCNLFLFFNPFAGQRRVKVTERRTKIDWAKFMQFLLLTVYPEAAVVVLVMDNLNTHGIGSLYAAFSPETARLLAARLEIHHTPKHGSWLNMAETELSILTRQSLDRRIESRDLLTREVATWEHDRNTRKANIDWQFTTADARIKLKRLYPSIHE